jgi:hypothetical protein
MAAADYTHSPTPEEIMEYVDGEGTAASRTGIEAHLAHCAACQVLASEQRRLSADVRAWHVDDAPASLRAPAPRRPRILAMRFPGWASPRLTVAAVGVVVVVAAIAIRAPLRREPALAVEARESLELQAALPERGTASGDSELNAPADTHRRARARLRGTASGDSELNARSAPAPAAAAMPRDATNQEALRRPAIIRTATLRIVTKDFDGVRPAVEGIVDAAGGFVDHMTATGDPGSVRALRGTLRIPSDRLGEMADRLRRLGQVVEDTQGSEDVADQLVDLDVRLRSARATERRLTELLRTRTGTLSDVLDVERELARVRVDIERLDAETTNLGRRVSYSTLTIEIVEERKAGLSPGPLSLASRFRIAAADGLESAMESIAWTLLSIVRTGPFLLLWTLVLGTGWLVLRRALGSRMRDSR